MVGHDIIVIGASAGGVEALVSLVGQLPSDLPASIFIVLHIPAQSPSILPGILSRSGSLAAVHPNDGDKIKKGTIYVALPDHHLLVERGRMRVVRGPKENRHRPAIDPLFRSAAVTYGPRVVGVVLTGSLDDGTAGLLAIKRQGGTAIVQDPTDALYKSMPLHALSVVSVDYTAPITQMGPLLIRLASEEIEKEGVPSVPDDMEEETKYVEMDLPSDVVSSNERVGKPSAYSCPDCGGVLWEVDEGELLRFRCRVGHAFSALGVLAAQSDQLEEALWTALKTLEESASLSNRLAEMADARGQSLSVKSYKKRQHELEHRALLIKQVLQNARFIELPESEIEGTE